MCPSRRKQPRAINSSFRLGVEGRRFFAEGAGIERRRTATSGEFAFTHGIERPLISRAAIHAESLTLPQQVTGETVNITAPWPEDLTVAVKWQQGKDVS